MGLVFYFQIRNSFFTNSRFNDHAPLAHYDPIEVDLVQMYGDHFYAAKSKDLYPGNDSEVSNAFFFSKLNTVVLRYGSKKKNVHRTVMYISVPSLGTA